jgi:hypothetical protein
MNKNKFYGIQKIVINGTRVYTLNISINPWTINKEGIIKDVLNQIQEENENFIL